MNTPTQAPLRIDIAGGWLDIPSLSRKGAYIINCAISPLVSINDWQYKQRAGLGGSGAYALLQGNDGVKAELDLGVGWQDPAVIQETGLCVWQSGHIPVLDYKNTGKILAGKLALYWTGTPHDTPSFVKLDRDYDKIEQAGHIARQAVLNNSLEQLADAMDHSYQAQLDEGMEPLPDIVWALAKKYAGGGWGGYAIYLFNTTFDRNAYTAADNTISIEPYHLTKPIKYSP